MAGRSWAINSLRGLQVFRHSSLRLLEDLVDSVGTAPLISGDIGPYVEHARQASFSLYWSLDSRFTGEHANAGGELPRAHQICLCAAPNTGAPLEALGHLLAYSIAEQLQEPAAVICLGPGGTFSAWHGGSFVGPQVLPERTDAAAILHEIDRLLPGKRRFMHLVYVVRRPRALSELRQCFHRIVYVTQRSELPAVPAHLQGLLKPKLWNSRMPAAPLFCSFVPTRFVAERGWAKPTPWTCAAGLLAAYRALAPQSSLRTQPVGQHLPPEPSGAWRLRRDAVCLAVDLNAVHGAWQQWCQEAAPSPFALSFFDRFSSCRGSLARWARAVTNRRVGVALSAPAQSAYRLIPFVRAFLDELDIPIDVIAGAGGGALLAAGYAGGGLGELEALAAGGRTLPFFGLGALASPALIGAKVDWNLRAARIEDLETRCVPLTVVLDDPGGPHAIVGGTIGEAVSASSCVPVPLCFDPLRWRRFSGGMAAAGVAARALREHGADVVFALSCIPPAALRILPTRSRCLEILMPSLTPISRAVEAWTGSGWLAQQASRAAAIDAHVYVEVPAGPSLVSDGLRHVAALVEEAQRELALGELASDAARCALVWEQFRCADAQRVPRTPL